jgi:hypothetical protein
MSFGQVHISGGYWYGHESLSRDLSPLMCFLQVLCGLGWMSDNATLQCVAIILPRVQVHFDLSSTEASLLSASTMVNVFLQLFDFRYSLLT